MHEVIVEALQPLVGLASGGNRPAARCHFPRPQVCSQQTDAACDRRLTTARARRGRSPRQPADEPTDQRLVDVGRRDVLLIQPIAEEHGGSNMPTDPVLRGDCRLVVVDGYQRIKTFAYRC